MRFNAPNPTSVNLTVYPTYGSYADEPDPDSPAEGRHAALFGANIFWTEIRLMLMKMSAEEMVYRYQ